MVCQTGPKDIVPIAVKMRLDPPCRLRDWLNVARNVFQHLTVLVKSVLGLLFLSQL